MDTKLQTFLTLCRLMNYRQTAEALHMTQPAVTKQIQSLEQFYGTKLFIYDGRKLKKTRACELLEGYCESLAYNYREIKKALSGSGETLIRIGATKTIGDYCLSGHIANFLSNSQNNLSLIVDNTEHLLKQIDSAELDFAVVEGPFDKKRYAHRLWRLENFTGICKESDELAGKTVNLCDIADRTLIVREAGSGTRDILERGLKSMGCDLGFFKKAVYISSFKLIRELILKNLGISFVYKSVTDGFDGFAEFNVEGLCGQHEFCVVYLKNTDAGKYADMFFGNEIE